MVPHATIGTVHFQSLEAKLLAGQVVNREMVVMLIAIKNYYKHIIIRVILENI